MRAAAAQPQIDARDVTLTIGVQAETRIVPTETKPNCPFPAQLELVPPMDNGKLAVGAADRRAVHRAQHAAGSAAQGPPFPGGRQARRSRSRCAAPASAPPATGC